MQARSVLLLGAGGGYDVLGAVPLFARLHDEGRRVHLGGVSFTNLPELPACVPHPSHLGLFAVTRAAAVESAYCPEAWLSAWLEQTYAYRQPVWGIRKSGVRPLRAIYAQLVEELAVDAAVLVDGGVDLLLRGDESSIGTPAEDLCSLAALESLPVATRLVACIGFGTELREGVRHAQVLRRISELSRLGGYLGTAALLRATAEGRAYATAVRFVLEHQRQQKGSHVQEVVLAAMEGRFGPEGTDTWISPLSSLVWFFDLDTVARSHLFLRHLHDTETIFDVTATIRACRQNLEVRASEDIPL